MDTMQIYIVRRKFYNNNFIFWDKQIIFNMQFSASQITFVFFLMIANRNLNPLKNKSNNYMIWCCTPYDISCKHYNIILSVYVANC